MILNSSEKDIEAAKTALEEGDLSDDSWAKVAKKYSQETTSAESGGVQPAPIEEGSTGSYAEQAFEAPVGELYGPVDLGARGFLLLEVTKDTPEKTQPLNDQLKLQIKSSIVTNRALEAFSRFQEEFFSKWASRTYCIPEAESELCAGFEVPEVETPEGQPAPPAVQAPQPIEPGTAEIPLASATGQFVQPQGEHPQGPGAGIQLPPADPTAGLPPGATSIPGGAAPPTGAPPRALPPRARPPPPRR